MGKLTKLPKRKLALNTIYCADNLEVMKQLPGESIDLIYIDPPFCTQTVHKSKAWDDKVQLGKFDDTWSGGLDAYIFFMEQRLEQMHRLLKPTGSLFVHADYRAIHYLKMSLDKIFGKGNKDKGSKFLINEIVWCYKLGGRGGKAFAKKHDTILWYAKDKTKYSFYSDNIRVPYDSTGGYISSGRKIVNGKEYKVNPNGKIPEDWWTIPTLNRQAKERLGYPTQKPLALLDRIIKSVTKKGDVVADFFCGCGTTMSAAHALDRKWVGVDASKRASTVIRKRMKDDHQLKVDAISLKSLSKDNIIQLHHNEFKKYMVRSIWGVPNENNGGGDGGVDGFLEDGTPIQVKQSHRVGRVTVDKLYQHMEKNGRGVIIALSFGKSAKNEVFRLANEKGWDLKLLTVDDIIRDYYNESA